MREWWSYGPCVGCNAMDGLGKRTLEWGSWLTCIGLQISAEDDSGDPYGCLHYRYERQGCEIVAELDGCAVLGEARKLN